MREKRERDVKSRGWGMPWAGAAALFWRRGVPFSSEGGRVFAGRREGMTIPGRRERRKGKGHDPQARGRGVPGGVFFRRGRAWSRAAKARRYSPVRGVLQRAGCAAASAPACPSPWLCRTLPTRRDFLQWGGDVHATLQSAGVLRKGEARRLPEDGRRMRLCGASNAAGSVKKTPVARMRQEQISGASADQMLW